MKLEDHLVQDTLLCRVAIAWLQVEITRSVLQAKSFLIRLLIMKFANHSSAESRIMKTDSV